MIRSVLIIEDEPQAAQRLETLIQEQIPGVTVLAKIDSVKRSVQWINEHESPDLIFMDIHLADGISFQIFEQCEIKAPVVFTTAYDEYALKAFKVNSIDYILKPVDKDELAKALKKLASLTQRQSGANDLLAGISEAMRTLTRQYKTRFIVKVGEHLRAIEVGSIQYFYSTEKTTLAHTVDGRKHILDFTLEQLEEVLDPRHFFRINRKYIVSPDAIKDMVSYANSRLKLILKGSEDADIIVARERVQSFKVWLDQ